MIKFFALGGVDEWGKNLYCLQFDEDIFVFNIGVSEVFNLSLGVTNAFADFNYLLKVSRNIKGLFLLSPIDDCAGALFYFLQAFPKVPLYASSSTIYLLKKKLRKKYFNLQKIDFISANPANIITNLNSQITIEPFWTDTQFIDTLGFAIHSPEGSVVIAGSTILKPVTWQKNRLDFHHLNQIAQKKIILFVSDAPPARYSGYATGQYEILPCLQQISTNKYQNIFFYLLQDNLMRVHESLLFLKKHEKDNLVVRIIGSQVLDILIYQQQHYHYYQNIKFIEEGLADYVFITGNWHFLYQHMMDLGVSGAFEKKKLTYNDLIIIPIEEVPGRELHYAAALDQLALIPARVISFLQKNIHNKKPHVEDLRFLINIFWPKYYLPVNGLHKELLAANHAASSVGLPLSCCFTLQPGYILLINNGIAHLDLKNPIVLENNYMSQQVNGIVNSIVVKERTRLSTGGLLMLFLILNQQKKMITPAKITEVGISIQNSEIMKKINLLCQQTIQKYYLNYQSTGVFPEREAQTEITRAVTRIVKYKLKKNTIVLSTIISLFK